MTGSRTSEDSRRIVNRLKLYFAALSCLGGLVLSSGSGAESIPAIAIFFAVFGYVFVDWLKLFALPPIAAYAAMAVAAIYCVSDFVNLDAPGNHQMITVARLLVLVQAILMLQKKSRRIFEQLGVFVLLELVVAAVFNNAINYGLLLIPIGILGACALSLLAALSAAEGLEVSDGLEREEANGFLRPTRNSTAISVSAPDTVRSLSSAAIRLPRVAMLSLAPSVLLVGAIFFYALPRTTDAARVRNRGQALVGFDDEVTLEQIGPMLQSTQTALRIYVKQRSTGKPYNVVGGIYLRGRVLENYRSEGKSARWTSAPMGNAQPLPAEYIPRRSTDANFYDSVAISVICESMKKSSLFAVAPYHQMKRNPEVVHFADRWTIGRRKADDWVYPRMTYSFGSNAFRSGIQTELIARRSRADSSLSQQRRRSADSSVRRFLADAEREQEDYLESLTQFDRFSMPTVAALSERFLQSGRGERRTDYAIAKAMERYFATSGDYEYTLDLSAEPVPGLDPIEQFLSVDKRGHCQYYASALAMMLRSVDIPSRVVVGYHTDEYNELGQHYVARQLHAHSWVEALVPRDQLNINRNIYGQPPAEQYWVRLDPTPAGGRIRESAAGVVQMLDMAQNMWDDYVVDMDAGRQDNTLLGGGIQPMTGSYDRFIDWLTLTISRIRAGELGGGSLANRNLFSWPAAVLGVVMTLTVVVLLRLRAPGWIKRRMKGKEVDHAARPSIPFYAETLDQLERAGVSRESYQTPRELAVFASEKLEHPLIPSISKPLDVLTSTFYRLRFGLNRKNGSPDLEMRDPIEHARQRSSEVDEALEELTRSVDLMMVRSSGAEQTP